MAVLTIPPVASSSFKDPVADASSLPVAENAIGDIRLVGSDAALYVWNGAVWIPLTGSSSANEVVEQITLSAQQIINKQVILAHTPTNPQSVEMTVIGGVDQEYGTDFVVSGTTLSWSSLSLDGILSAGDILKINYLY